MWDYRQTLRTFLWSLRSPEGAFSMHIDGEIDIRGAYCALTVATLTDIASVGLFAGTAEWVKSCQTYEGGFSGYPGMEAHGGYTFCGVAALVLLQKLHLCDSENLLVNNFKYINGTHLYSYDVCSSDGL